MQGIFDCLQNFGERFYSKRRAYHTNLKNVPPLATSQSTRTSTSGSIVNGRKVCQSEEISFSYPASGEILARNIFIKPYLLRLSTVFSHLYPLYRPLASVCAG